MEKKKNFYTTFLLPAIATTLTILFIAAMCTLFKYWQNNLLKKELPQKIEIVDVVTYNDNSTKIIISVEGQEYAYWKDRAE